MTPLSKLEQDGIPEYAVLVGNGALVDQRIANRITEPRLLVAMGTCQISDTLARPFEESLGTII